MRPQPSHPHPHPPPKALRSPRRCSSAPSSPLSAAATSSRRRRAARERRPPFPSPRCSPSTRSSGACRAPFAARSARVSCPAARPSDRLFFFVLPHTARRRCLCCRPRASWPRRSRRSVASHAERRRRRLCFHSGSADLPGAFPFPLGGAGARRLHERAVPLLHWRHEHRRGHPETGLRPGTPSVPVPPASLAGRGRRLGSHVLPNSSPPFFLPPASAHCLGHAWTRL